MPDWLDVNSLMNKADQLSTVGLAAWCSGTLVALTWIAIVCFKPLRRSWIHREPNFNSLVNYATGSFGLCYGLLLSLLAVATYQNSARVQASVDNEATIIASLYGSAKYYPEPLGGELQYLLRDYTLYVVYKDWPAHKVGKIWSGGALRLQAIQNKILSFVPINRMQELVQQQSLSTLDKLNDARQQRLTGVRTAMPAVLWGVVAIGLVINILLFSLLDTGLLIHMTLGAIIASFLGMLIFLILAMDRPLQGSVSVSPDRYELIYELTMRPDERL
jgi:hypothetical protein